MMMTETSQHGPGLSDTRFDLIVIGGGIHGLMIGLHAAETGRRTLLLEKGKIAGGATSGWFGILHGGLRYLQSVDIPRFRASLSDSRWFVRNFPDSVAVQPFLVPLYGKGLKRRSIFRLAFLIDRMLGLDRNAKVPPHLAIPAGRTLSRQETETIFSGFSRDGLRGGALWHELVVPDSTALIAALKRRAEGAGLTIQENAEAKELVLENGHVAGVATMGRQWQAPAVVNACGAWTPDVAMRFDPSMAGPVAHPAKAFNVLLNKAPLVAEGLALTPDDGGMIFAYPQNGKLFAGTGYLPTQSAGDAGIPSLAVRDFLTRLNAALPGLDASLDDVLEVSSGLLPAASAMATDLLDRDVIVDHGARGGPKGLVSLCGVKFTTAPSVARRVLSVVKGWSS